MLKGKKIILGVTGSIAAYKAAVLLRLLVKQGAEVQVIMTPAAKEFITPVTMAALSGRPVLGSFFERSDGQWHSHVDLGLWADLMLIAPASTNTIGKMVAGICDNLLLTTYLSAKCPVFLAPAMDLDMYRHTANQRNLTTLIEFGNYVIEPGAGELASGLIGKGRMEEPEEIVNQVKAFFSTTESDEEGALVGKRIMVTAGPTYEKIDPVRYIGNFSSGKMGFAIAEALAQRGAEVTLICGPVNLETTHPRVSRIDIVEAKEMFVEAKKAFEEADGAIMCAAVADFTPVEKSEVKIKRQSEQTSLELVANPDIAFELGQVKKDGQLLVGFALETNDGVQNARHKLNKKNLDFIVLNSLEDKGAGFGVDTNKISILKAGGNKLVDFPLKSKGEVANDIVDHVVAFFVD